MTELQEMMLCYIPSETTEIDVISREHEHMGVLCAELWKENKYVQRN